VPRHLESVLPSVVVALATALIALAFTTLGNPALAIEDCTASPEQSAPPGSHWYYRTDRTTQRKCWYLGPQNPKVQNATPRTMPQGPRAAELATPPVAGGASEGVTPPKQFELRKTQAWPTMNAGEATPAPAPAIQWPAPPAVTPNREGGLSAFRGQEQALKDVYGSGALVEQPVQQSVFAADITAESDAVTDVDLVLFIGALAIIGLLLRGIVATVARRRRPTRVRIAVLTNSHRAPAKVSGTSFPPIPPMMLIDRDDDVERALRQSSRAWKRKAA
jgi:hypothetical protein